MTFGIVHCVAVFVLHRFVDRLTFLFRVNIAFFYVDGVRNFLAFGMVRCLTFFFGPSINDVVSVSVIFDPLLPALCQLFCLYGVPLLSHPLGTPSIPISPTLLWYSIFILFDSSNHILTILLYSTNPNQSHIQIKRYDSGSRWSPIITPTTAS